MNGFEARQQARKERLEAAADRARSESQARFDLAGRMADVIPLGQPILVGHHSEKRDRRYRERIARNMDKGVEASKRADDLGRRAASVGSGGVSSDDPDAVVKLRAQLQECERLQERDTNINKLVRRKDRAGLLAMGLGEALVGKLFEGDFMGRKGIPDYEIRNRGANIRRIKARIAQLEAARAAPERTPINGEGWRVVEDRDLNRVCIEFDAIPSKQTRTELGSFGFHWSRTRGAWMRQTSEQAWYHAERIARASVQGAGQ